MKMKALHFSHAMCAAIALILLCGMSSLQAQAPPNDLCANAALVAVGADEASAIAVAGDTRFSGDGATQGGPAMTCSANFYRDDVWYKFTCPTVPPGSLVVIDIETGTESTDMASGGLALYTKDCATTNQPIVCITGTTGDTEVDHVGMPISCLVQGTEYLVRVWSAAGTAAAYLSGAGTFRIKIWAQESTSKDIPVWCNSVGQFDGGWQGWTNNGISCGNKASGATVPADSATWVWDPKGSALTGTFSAGQSCLSPSVCNGAMVMNSDWLDSRGAAGQPNHTGQCPVNQNAELISPVIDLSGNTAAGLTLRFHQNFRHYLSSYFVGWSTDNGATWQETEINADEETNGDHVNREARVYLKGVTNQNQVRVKFRYEGNYYYWVIDDVCIVEREAINLKVNDNFYAIAPNAIWDKDQQHSFGFLADISNIGANTTTGTKLKAEVIDKSDNSVKFTTTNLYGTFPADSVWENKLFIDVYTPNLPVGNYRVKYTLSNDLADFDESDNSVSSDFEIGTNQMYKSIDSVAGGIRAADNFNWTFGNGYLMPKGGSKLARNFVVAVSNPDEHKPSVIGTTSGMELQLWKLLGDANGDFTIQAAERELVGFNSYQFTDGELAATTTYHIPVLDVNTLDPDVALEDNTVYLVTMKYVLPSGQTALPLFIASSTAHQYAAATFITEQEGYEPFIPNNLLDVGNTGDFNSATFNSGTVGYINLELADKAAGSPPVANFNTTGSNGVYSFTDQSTNNPTGWSWNFGDGSPVSALQNPTHTFPQNGKQYNVCLIATNQFGSSQQFCKSITGVKDLDAANAVKVYPIPASDNLTLEVKLVNTADELNVKFTDIHGKFVMQHSIHNVKEGKFPLEVTNLSDGNYLMTVETKDGVRAIPVVIQK